MACILIMFLKFCVFWSSPVPAPLSDVFSSFDLFASAQLFTIAHKIFCPMLVWSSVYAAANPCVLVPVFSYIMNLQWCWVFPMHCTICNVDTVCGIPFHILVPMIHGYCSLFQLMKSFVSICSLVYLLRCALLFMGNFYCMLMLCLFTRSGLPSPPSWLMVF